MLQTNSAALAQVRAETSATPWATVYRVGAAAALVSVVGIPLQIAAYIVAPPPSTVLGYFQLFQANWLLGLASIDLFYLLTNIILILTVPALTVALWRTHPSLTVLGALLGLVGIVALIAARPAFEMASLSRQYALAATDGQRTGLLAAGELILAMLNGTAYQLHLIVGSIGFLLLSIAMLDTPVFGKPTGWVGIAANAVTLFYFLPGVGIYMLLLSVLFFWVWYLQIARALWRLR